MSGSKHISLVFIGVLFGLSVQAQSINWTSLSEAQEKATEENKKVMIFAEAEWCSYCKKMHKQVFPKESVQDSLHKYFYPVRVDIESDKKITFNGNEFTERELSRKFRVSSTPTFIFVNEEGDIIGVQPGYLPANIFDKLLPFVGNDMTGTISFEDYLNEHGVNLE